MGGTRNSKDIVWTYAVMYRLTHLSSGILRFDDNINDLDFFSKFKYTELCGALCSNI